MNITNFISRAEFRPTDQWGNEWSTTGPPMAHHCFACQEIIDHEGNFVSGNTDCFNIPENTTTYESTCTQEGNGSRFSEKNHILARTFICNHGIRKLLQVKFESSLYELW